MRAVRWALWGLLGLVGIVLTGALALWLTLRHPLPSGAQGPDADALAHAVERTVDLDAWARTLAVRWSFGGRFHHLWDRARNFDRVGWGRNQVLLDTGQRTGRAWHDGVEVTGAAAEPLVAKAYASFINDSFWLNPVAKFFDEGVTRERVELDGRPALLVHYGKGGLTPGDRYLWLLDGSDRPRAWRLYVSILPIRGVEISWEGWVPLATGARISTVHRALGMNAVPIGELAGAARLDQLEPGADPFAAIAH